VAPDGIVSTVKVVLVPRVIVAQPDKAMMDTATIATNFNFIFPPKKSSKTGHK
jgi:hypothetical protein